MTDKKYPNTLDEIYVTIGTPAPEGESPNLPIRVKTLCFVDHEIETIVDVAKHQRKMVSDRPQNYGYWKGQKFNPSELYYEVYERSSDEDPIAASANAPHQPKEKEKE
jgi:hypothetical protein